MNKAITIVLDDIKTNLIAVLIIFIMVNPFQKQANVEFNLIKARESINEEASRTIKSTEIKIFKKDDQVMGRINQIEFDLNDAERSISSHIHSNLPVKLYIEDDDQISFKKIFQFMGWLKSKGIVSVSTPIKTD